MLHVVEQSQRSDTGRQRTANEDSYFARAPLFAVADGMGGAQAGEVASRIAAEAFEPADPSTASSPETFLREIVELANGQINDHAKQDSSRSGMGTTLTAALVSGDELALAHVGDSRAYRFRDGELTLLTSDHSLVEELRRQGRLTAKEAEEHPQRSIITRALGPEPEVEVDTMTYRARPGDVYLLCSDGLTTMVREPEIQSLLGDAPNLESATRELIAAANEAGGRDNITVVAFRLAGEPDSAEPDLMPTMIGPSEAEAGMSADAIRAQLRRARAASLGGAAAEPAPVPTRGRRLLKVLVGLIILGLIVVAALGAMRKVHFLGADDDGRLTLYRGLPYELPLGVDLYTPVETSPVQIAALPEDRRDLAVNHELRSLSDARSLLEDLEASAVTEPAEPSEPQPTPGSGTGGNGGSGGGGSGGGDTRGAGAQG